MESHEVLLSSPQKAGTRIELQERTAHAGVQNSQSFFAWINDHDTRRASIRDAKIIPWKGIIALVVSALTTFSSMALLLMMERRRELYPTTGIYRVMQPASWLSALMSINGAALHIALLEGVTVAWWYRATRPTANLSDLHSLWHTGTSSWGAAAGIGQLSYVSLAALFVAVLPLNAFLLQAAVTTPLTLIQKYSNIPVPISRYLPYGYSGKFTPDGSAWGYIDTVTTAQIWTLTFQQVKNIAGSKYAGYAYMGAYDQCADGATNCTDVYVKDGSTPPDSELLGNRYYFNDTKSTFSFNAQGVGFKYDCQESTVPYDLMPVANGSAKSDSIFYTDIQWDNKNPNVMTVEMRWKSDSACVGSYEHRFCTLTAATVEYPVEMQLDVASKYRGPYFSLPSNTSWQDDKVIEELGVFNGESEEGWTTFGGIAYQFSDWYGANTSFTFWPDGAWTTTNYGPLSYGVEAGFWNYTSGETPMCEVSMTLGLSSVNYFERMTKRDYAQAVEFGAWAYSEIGSPIDLVLNQIRQSMFFASVYQGAAWYSWSYSYNTDGSTFERVGNESDYVQHVDALRTKTVPTYKIRWALWGASIAITYSVILLIIPTFWGFWVLRVKPTLSPIDVARALNAPVVDHDHQNHLDVDDLLKEVGRKNIHHDLRQQNE